MNDLFSFDIDAVHHARQLVLDKDRVALASLGCRCADYLRAATGQKVSPQNVARVLPLVLQPKWVMQESGFLLGIYFKSPAGDHASPRLVGLLSFLRPLARRETWCLHLLLLEPAARGKGLGTMVHRVFVQWAMARGAECLVVTVLDNNPRACRFWRERMGYEDVAMPALNKDGTLRQHIVMQYHLQAAGVSGPWAIQRPGDPLATA